MMAKKGKSTLPGSHLPIAPWIYINDPTESAQYASELATLLPKVEHIQLTKSLKPTATIFTTISSEAYRGKVIITTSPTFTSDPSVCMNDAQLLRQSAIKRGCNFASVNLLDNATRDSDCLNVKSWGTNHLTEYIDIAADFVKVRDVAEKIYKWLFSVFSVLETLHLIPDEQMKEIEPNSPFKNYEYCPLSEANKRPKNQKIQFVALIVSKPVVGPNKRLSWQVADKSGTATFFFQFRGPCSQYTWDWVLALKPGDRKSLPRMSSVLVKERLLKTIVKAPFRVTGFVIRDTGLVIAGVGRGIAHIGSKIKMGPRAEWVPEMDVGTDAKGRKFKKRVDEDEYVQHKTVPSKSEIKVFTPKGEKMWKDDDSLASTTAGSFVNVKISTFE